MTAPDDRPTAAPDVPEADADADAEDTVLWADRVTDSSGVVLVLHGELDISTFALARREVAAVERGDSPSVLVLDLSRLDFIDSTGIRLVLLAQATAEAAGRRLAVRLGAGRARRLFTTLGIVDRIDVLDTEPGHQPSS
jgi:anti-anti-sigma factor